MKPHEISNTDALGLVNLTMNAEGEFRVLADPAFDEETTDRELNPGEIIQRSKPLTGSQIEIKWVPEDHAQRIMDGDEHIRRRYVQPRESEDPDTERYYLNNRTYLLLEDGQRIVITKGLIEESHSGAAESTE